MGLPTDIVSYIMPTMMALAIGYFFYARGKAADAGSYEDDAKAKELHFNSLTTMFIVVATWLVVMLLSTFISI